MSRGAWMPMRTFSPMIERTLTSMSSPIMMLWLDFRVRTSMERGGVDLPACGALCHVPFTKANRAKQPARRETGGHVASRADGTTLAEAPPEPDPHLGAPGARRCMDLTSHRGHRPADRRLQAR